MVLKYIYNVQGYIPHHCLCGVCLCLHTHMCAFMCACVFLCRDQVTSGDTIFIFLSKWNLSRNSPCSLCWLMSESKDFSACLSLQCWITSMRHSGQLLIYGFWGSHSAFFIAGEVLYQLNCLSSTTPPFLLPLT